MSLPPLPPASGSRPTLFSTAAPPDWQAVTAVMQALQADDPAQALAQLLAAGAALSGSAYLALYQLQKDSPVLLRSAAHTPDEAACPLPEQLAPHELINLQEVRLWQAGHRSATSLQRAARLAGWSGLACAPLGPARALIGLLVAGGPQADPERLAQTLPVLAAAAAGIVQSAARQSALAQQNDVHTRRLLAADTLQTNSREGLLSLRPDLRIAGINPAAELMLGYAEAEVRDQPVEKILIGAEALLPALSAAQDGSATHHLGSTRLYRRSGDAFLARLRIFPVLHAHQVIEIIVFIEDQQEQEQIRLQTQQLEQRALLGEVTAVFAHEVRNPINNISTGLQLMAMTLPPEDPGQESVARMLQDCDRLAELMKSVLAFSRPAEYEMEPLDMPELLWRLLERLRPRITRLNVQPDLQIAADCPPVSGNLRALEQVFSNLITNALQAMGEGGGHLTIKLQPVSVGGRRFLEVGVADNGPGIPPEVQEHIFQPFFTTERSGTGLGLAIVKRILTAHRGDIRLDSFPGGTVFKVRLPVA